MKIRTVLMYIEIGSFVTCVVGWIVVCSTLPMEYWSYSEVQSSVLTTNHYHSNLWKDCSTDTTGTTDCKRFPTLLGLESQIHLCRGLIISAVLLGIFGGVLALVGMKCTKIGGSEIANARVTFTAGLNYLISGICSMYAYSLYGYTIVTAFLNVNHNAQKYELGTALYFGWGGSFLLIIGGLIYVIVGGQGGCRSSLSTKKSLIYSTYGTTSSEITEPSEQATKYPPSLQSSEDAIGAKDYKKNEYV